MDAISVPSQGHTGREALEQVAVQHPLLLMVTASIYASNSSMGLFWLLFSFCLAAMCLMVLDVG